MAKKKIVSMLLVGMMLVSMFSTAVFATENNTMLLNEEQLADLSDQTLIAEEITTVQIPLELDEIKQMKSELDELGISYTISGNRAVAIVNVTTRIHYDNELYFSIIAQCQTTLLQKITGFIKWKYKTTGAYSTPRTISVNFKDSFGVPRYTLTCLKYTGKKLPSGTKIIADFNVDVDATKEISGGIVSRTVTATIP